MTLILYVVFIWVSPYFIVNGSYLDKIVHINYVLY